MRKEMEQPARDVSSRAEESKRQEGKEKQEMQREKKVDGSKLNPDAISWPVGGARAKTRNVSLQTTAHDIGPARVIKSRMVRTDMTDKEELEDQKLREEAVEKETGKCVEERQVEPPGELHNSVLADNCRGLSDIIGWINNHWMGIFKKEYYGQVWDLEEFKREVERLREETLASQKKEFDEFLTQKSEHNSQGVNNLTSRINERWQAVSERLAEWIDKQPEDSGVEVGLGALGY